MQSWIYFALAAQLIWAVCSLIDKIVISKGHIKNPVVYIVINGFTHMLILLMLPFLKFEPLKITDFLIALLAGITLSAAVTIYYKAVQYDEISKIKIMFQLEPIFVLVFSFLILGEVLTKNYFIGFIILVAAGLAVSYQKAGKSFKLSKSFYLVLASMIIGAFSAVLAKHIFSITGFWNAFIWLRLTSIIALAVLLAPSIRQEFSRTLGRMETKTRGLLVFKIFIDFSAFIFAGLALFRAPVSLLSALETSAAPLFTFIFALLLTIYFPKVIREKIDKKSISAKILAIALIIIGILLINL